MQQQPNQSDDIKWGLICYVPVVNIVTCMVTAVVKIKSKYALFHARQGLVLFVSWFVTILVAFISPVLSLMMWGAVLLLHAAGMMIAYGGKTTKIPILGDFAMRIPETYFFTLLTQKTLDGEEEEKLASAQTEKPPVVTTPDKEGLPAGTEGKENQPEENDPPQTNQ